VRCAAPAPRNAANCCSCVAQFKPVAHLWVSQHACRAHAKRERRGRREEHWRKN
jgi:hypothetical protein